jgi:hypothetical protein
MFTLPASMPFSSKASYYEVENDDFLDNSNSFPRLYQRRSRFGSTWPWVCSTIIFGLGFTTIFVNEYILHRPSGTFEKGFNTELGTATHIIGLEKFRFTGNINFRLKENGTAYESYLMHEPGTKRYVGKPSKEIDANWQELIRDRYFWVSDEEAASMWPDELDTLYHREGKGYVAG